MIPVPMYGDDVGTPGEQIARVADRVCLTVPGVNIGPKMQEKNIFFQCDKKCVSKMS